MAQSVQIVANREIDAGRRQGSAIAPVGASYGFDPGADGIAGIYAARVLERGADPRRLCADIRADRLGSADREPRRRALKTRHRATRFGRGTAYRFQGSNAASAPVASSRGFGATASVLPVASREKPPSPLRTGRGGLGGGGRPRQFAIAGLLAALIFPLGVMLANAQDSPPQSRYIVQAGDTLEAVAAELGVDPAAILAPSAFQNPPYLTAAEVVVIPDPGESPDAAAANAAMPGAAARLSSAPTASRPTRSSPASPQPTASIPGRAPASTASRTSTRSAPASACASL